MQDSADILKNFHNKVFEISSNFHITVSKTGVLCINLLYVLMSYIVYRWLLKLEVPELSREKTEDIRLPGKCLQSLRSRQNTKEGIVGCQEKTCGEHINNTLHSPQLYIY